MCSNPVSGELGLTDQNHACSFSTDSHGEAAGKTTDIGESTSDVTRAHYLVDGMTCSHCVASVTEEVSAIDGVESVRVDLNAGGTSRIMVVSARPIAEVLINAAVSEAGYTLASAH